MIGGHLSIKPADGVKPMHERVSAASCFESPTRVYSPVPDMHASVNRLDEHSSNHLT